MLNADRTAVALGDVLALLIDHRGRTPKKLGGDFVAGGIPVISAKSIRDGRIVLEDNARCVSPEMFTAWMPQKLSIGDVLLTSEAPLGEAAYLRYEANYCLGQRLFALRGKPSVIDNRFLYYALVSNDGQQRLHARATGTTAQGIRQSQLVKVVIDLPPIGEQRGIASVLGALDDKIDLNRRMNETLEAMARALFKSWFVDFEPMRAKTGGEQPWGMHDATAALFPGTFEDSELGEVPRGWRVAPIDSMATFLNGLPLQNYPPTSSGSLPVIKIAELRRGITESSNRASFDVAPQYIIEDGDVLFSWSGSLECVVWCGGPGALNQHLFKVTSESVPAWFFYQWVHQHLPSFRAIASGKATTMGHIQRHHLKEALVVVPNEPVLEAANALMSPLWDKSIANRLESRTLTELRDTLLPKLLSGEVRVGAAEKVLEAAT